MTVNVPLMTINNNNDEKKATNLLGAEKRLRQKSHPAPQEGSDPIEHIHEYDNGCSRPLDDFLPATLKERGLV